MTPDVTKTPPIILTMMAIDPPFDTQVGDILLLSRTELGPLPGVVRFEVMRKAGYWLHLRDEATSKLEWAWYAADYTTPRMRSFILQRQIPDDVWKWRVCGGGS